MSTTLDDAFTDTPPILADGTQILPFSERASAMLRIAMRSAGDDSDEAVVAAMVCVSKGNIRPTREQLDEALITLSDADFLQIANYISRVIERRAKAAVEVAEQPGK